MISWPTYATEAKVCRSYISTPLLLLLIWTVAWCNSWPSWAFGVNQSFYDLWISQTRRLISITDWWVKLSKRWWSEMHEDFSIAGAPADHPPDSWLWGGELKELEPFKEPGTGANCDGERGRELELANEASISHAESSVFFDNRPRIFTSPAKKDKKMQLLRSVLFGVAWDFMSFTTLLDQKAGNV